MAKANHIVAFVVFLIIVCAVLAVYLLYNSNVKIMKQSRQYRNKTLVYDDYSFKNDKLVYLVCDKDTPSKCKVIEEKFAYKSVHSRSCNVSLDVEGKLHEESIFIVAFGVNDTILLWDDDKSKLGGKTYARISVVHLDSCQQTKYNEYDSFTTAQFKNTKKIIPYYYTFDIFYKNYTKCGYQECPLPLKSDGNYFSRIATKMTNYGSDISNIYPIQNQGPDKGLVYLRSFPQHSDLWIILSDERDHRYLTSFIGEIKMSVVDESIGICSRADINSNITCLQYNATGAPVLNVTLTDVNNITHLQNMYTLREGGFLLSFVDFGRCQEDICDPSLLSNYFILKIDAAGEEIGKLRVHGLEKDVKGIKHSYIYKMPKKDEYCAVIVPLSKRNDKLDVLVNCFPMSNFAS